MSNTVDKRITEQSSLYEHLEKMSVDELTAHINAENKKVALAIEEALPAINQLISAIEHRLLDSLFRHESLLVRNISIDISEV